MTAHRVNKDLGEAVRLGFGIGLNPGTGNTLNLEGKSGVAFVLSAGTYTIPNATAGTQVVIIATGAVSIRTVASASVILYLASGQSGQLIATTASTWSSVLLKADAAYPPTAKFTTSSTATALIAPAGALTGADHVFWQNTADGALEVTTRTATEMFGDITGAYVGMTYLLTIVNRGNNTVTLTGSDDVTVSGEATIATLVTRTYMVTFTSATAVTILSVNKGTIET